MHSFLLAALNDIGELPLDVGAGRRGSAGMDDIFLIVGLSFALLLVLAFWAKFIRKAAREDADPSRILREADSKSGSSERRRRTRRQRFPTLAESGGLPPVREQSPPR